LPAGAGARSPTDAGGERRAEDGPHRRGRAVRRGRRGDRCGERAWHRAAAEAAIIAVCLVGAAATAAIGGRLTSPTAPGLPSLGIIAAAGLAVSLLLASALAAALERLDRTVRDARGVEAALGLPTLGLIPRLGRSESRRQPHEHLRERPTSPYAEAVRAVLAALGTDEPGRSRVVLVTSSLPGEGKTTFALSLATLAARSGGRVLVIDLDLRQPNVHRALGHQAVDAGIVEHVAEGRPLAEVVRRDPATGLDFLPVGQRTAHPTELVESDRMRGLLDACRAGYDLVVVDTAPVGLITDAGIAARVADQVVFVVRSGRTPAGAAREALRSLRAAGVEPAGVVLTQADP
jgi:capsular exopolysaccharide synthesis family protein